MISFGYDSIVLTKVTADVSESSDIAGNMNSHTIR